MPFIRTRPLWLLPLAFALLIAPAVRADDTDAARLEALRQAVAQIGQSGPAALVCWTPHDRFSPVGVAAEVPYGPRLLLARYDHPPVAQNTFVLLYGAHTVNYDQYAGIFYRLLGSVRLQ